VTALANGNYVVSSPDWNGERGAATWGDGTRGVSGAVDASNSLVGSDPGDLVGGSVFGPGGVTALADGNYVVASPDWNGDRGAVTWGDGTAGVTGPVGASNTLLGSNPNDLVGGGGVRALADGNYVVSSPNWDDNRGAATWGDGTQPVTGTVSAGNSLVGSDPGDQVGYGTGAFDGVTALGNGNYLVQSPSWNGDRGAVTWGDGAAGVTGPVGAGNSLVGSNPNDQVGDGVTALANGNYVVETPSWNAGRGAVTWGDGTAGVRGPVDASISLVGSNPNDQVGLVFVLSNGNYVVESGGWNGGRGAVTWGDATTGVRGMIDATNSLVRSNPGDGVGSGVTALPNGNYVVQSPNWNRQRGAATWGDGTAGVTGPVDTTNSLVGSNPTDTSHLGDQVGSRVTALANGNYVVQSPNWNGLRGAATWGDGTAGIRGPVDPSNSLVGSNAGDRVGGSQTLGLVFNGVTALADGNYVVQSPNWNGNRGAATWGDGTAGVTGTISAGKSLVGTTPGGFLLGDQVGQGVTALSNGNYVVQSPNWNGKMGAATWGDGTAGVTGPVGAGNSLLGSNPNDQVGLGVTALADGNYVVRSPGWDGGLFMGRGAVTWGDGTAGVTGPVSAANSLVGANPNDQVGAFGVWVVSNGNYVVASPYWDGRRGAATWGSGAAGVTGAVGAGNSLVGANPNDLVGGSFAGVTALANGNYVVGSPNWDGNRGAATWGDGTVGITGAVGAGNSLVGSDPGDLVGNGSIAVLGNGNYVVKSPNWNGNRGATTWGDGTAGITGVVDASNSLVG
jgi:hypothetical protein